ncbi:MAG TPA: SDR family oxidoreductase [Phycisphaerae bacterium]|nr:SDR family oxidoreductase [Phycisphaerae bacterium]HPM23063.1 SDR family oxidoreductase [Phycisphaerae bacterium]
MTLSREDKRVTEQTCVITGASRGIGLATASEFAQRGWRIVAAARRSEDLTAAAEQIKVAGGVCTAVPTDVGQAAEAQALIRTAQERCGRIDVLVNNAGVAPLCATAQLDPAEFDHVFAVNMAAIYHTTRAVWPLMQAQGGGTIINISSLASVDPFPGFAVYGASKAWVNVFTQATAAEGKPHNIRVFSVAPGAVETSLMRAAFPKFPPEKTLAPEAVARVIVALCDPGMTPCSGQTIFVRK